MSTTSGRSSLFQSGFHRLAFLFFLLAAAVWFYVFYEWWGLLAAVLLCVPVGLLFSLLPPMVIGSLRQLHISDAVLTWGSVVAGIALGLYAFLAQSGTTLAILALSAVGMIVGGVGLLQMRLNAMEYRAAMGEASEDDARFLEDIHRR
jgi:hypothetical protein